MGNGGNGDNGVASFTCPKCGATSHHPEDVRHGYCGRCHAFTRGEAPEVWLAPTSDAVAWRWPGSGRLWVQVLGERPGMLEDGSAAQAFLDRWPRIDVGPQTVVLQLGDRGLGYTVELLRGRPADPRPDLVLPTVIRTLRWVAGHLHADDGAGTVPDEPAAAEWSRSYYDLADMLERHGMEVLEGCCPACEEVVCDTGCPLEELRR